MYHMLPFKKKHTSFGFFFMPVLYFISSKVGTFLEDTRKAIPQNKYSNKEIKFRVTKFSHLLNTFNIYLFLLLRLFYIFNVFNDN